jgi:putative tryptophan/tyrosine transport system substrate-binding protein
MRRREFITGLGGAAAWSLAARAQQPKRIRRVGILRAGLEADAFQASDKTFLEGLAQLGWAEGRNLRIDYRSTNSNDPDAIRPHAEALVRAAPDVIFTSPATAVQVLQRLTRTIPIVFVQSGDPVQGGSVQSIARPGGNITGFVTFASSINTKFPQLLKDMAPQVIRVSVLQTLATSWRGDFAVIEAVAPLFAVAPVTTLIRDDPADIERAIAAFAQQPNGGLILPPDGITLRHRVLIVALAAKHRLPSVYSYRSFVDAGGLMSYAAAPTDFRQVAAYVDRILRGAKPAELPVQLPKITAAGAREKIAHKTYIRASGFESPEFDQTLARMKASPGWKTYEVASGHDVMIDMPDRRRVAAARIACGIATVTA